MATAAYSSGRSLSCDSIVGAPPEQRSAEGSASRPSHDYDRQRIDDDEDELIELVDEDDEMEDRKSIEDTTTSNPQSPEKGINQDDFTNSAPKTQVTNKPQPQPSPRSQKAHSFPFTADNRLLSCSSCGRE